MMNNQDLTVLTEHLSEIKNWHQYHYNYSSISDLMSNKDHMRDWCKEHLKGKWHNYFSLWYFKEESDYLLFLMRWS